MYYIKRRVLGERSTTYTEINHIKRIAQSLASTESRDKATQDAVFRDYTVRVCALLNKDRNLCNVFQPWNMRYWEQRFRYDLLTAAAWTGKEELAAHLADVGLVNSPSQGIFMNASHPAFEAAITARNHRIFDILFECVDHPLSRDLRIMQALIRASKAGQIETVDHVLKFKWAPPSNTGYRYDNEIFESTLKTPSIWIFNTLLEAKEKRQSKFGIPPERFKQLLPKSIEEGWTDMAKHLISIGAPLAAVLGIPGEDNMHIIKACEAGHTDIVRLLLEHGANMTDKAILAAAEKGHLSLVELLYDHGLRSEAALPAAVAGGNFRIVKFLVEKGGDVNAGSPPSVVSAVQLEHTAMFRYLVERGAVLNTGSTGGEAVGRAKAAGLESMLALLQDCGVDLGDKPSPCSVRAC
jgi:hypothetical protein